jgi:hypothetical protein
MANRRKINLEVLQEMYDRGDSLADIADTFDCTLPAVHYALVKIGAPRNRLGDRAKYSMTINAIRQRLRRNQSSLEQALEEGSAADIRHWGELVCDEKRNMAQAKKLRALTAFEEWDRYDI